ncbi:uncharacterized protein LOC142229190 [Haematobia irritans]|uniref:uncharacterized protein LOC142229190 n=1 Tax=Haematobia irritans TaxID=7368 RepID=UPI003F50A245
MWFTLTLILIVMEYVIPTEALKRSVIGEFHNVSCITFDALMQHAECDIVKLANDQYSLNIMFQLTRTMPSSVEVGVAIHIRGMKRQRVFKFIDAKIKICDLLRVATSIPFINQVMIKIKRASNLPMACPVKGNIMYNITNLILADEVFPEYTPVVLFNATLDFTNKGKLLVTYRLQGATKLKSN